METAQPKSISMNIKLEYFRDKFRARLGADMISLRVLISSINDKSFAKFQNHESKGFVFQSVMPTMDQGLIDYEVIKTYISMMRNVNDYLDQMVAIINLSKKKIRVPHPMSIQEAQVYYQSILNEEIMNYCSQTKEEMKDKLKHFGDFPSEFVKYMTTYNLLRNCYEHHKAISKKGLQIPIKKMGLYTQDGKEVEIGKVIQGGSTISVKFSQKTINIKKGQPALLTYEDLVSTELYLMLEVPVQIEKTVMSIIKKSIPTAKTNH
ncbi:hypothetical protein COY48_00160 [Candidatus Collierbacteria bacterium CG_4_10_14_0_8_um_filter_43_86]|nr:MAG: hypothetical protein COY48_00160 [Candidatus Collierbacteria bacterium CG_4_10_14_0_8_um_filter_43_86]